MHRPKWTALVAAALFGVGLVGCGGPPVAPVKGKLTFKGKPLTSGSVMFQPTGGQPARGTIGPDGSFTLSTFGDGDGALIGKHQVRVASYEGQRPSTTGGESTLGKSLIPEKYTNFSSSGLTFEVKADGPNEWNYDLPDASNSAPVVPIGP